MSRCQHGNDGPPLCPTRANPVAAFAWSRVRLSGTRTRLTSVARWPTSTAHPWHHDAKVEHDPTVMALAHDLDHLEKHIDWFGSVTAKGPDVWGQARLTRYREEIEEQLRPQLGKFDEQLRLQGQVARSDQALFVTATALGLAAAPPGRRAVAPAPVPTAPAAVGQIQYLTPPLARGESRHDRDGLHAVRRRGEDGDNRGGSGVPGDPSGRARHPGRPHRPDSRRRGRIAARPGRHPDADRRPPARRARVWGERHRPDAGGGARAAQALPGLPGAVAADQRGGRHRRQPRLRAEPDPRAGEPLAGQKDRHRLRGRGDVHDRPGVERGAAAGDVPGANYE